jgi:surface carbohydrate biosynthesis protein (TIGR04326 family)
LCHAWRRRGHGRLAGSIHSTIRYWDLRYHCDPRRYGGDAQRIPLPGLVVVNGPAASRAYLSTCDHREGIVEAEALRYLHLGGPRESVPAAARSRLSILVLGDYLLEGTEAVLRLVEAACAESGAPADVRLKPHPACPVDPQRFPRFRFTVVTSDAAVLAREAHLVVSGNLTSAAVDAYVAGASVLVHDDGRGLNYSPLRGEPGVKFIRSAAELRVQMDAARAAPANTAGRSDFFHTDRGLPRWRRHFGIVPEAAS